MLLLEHVEKHQEGHIHIENWPLSLLPINNLEGERDRLCDSLGLVYQVNSRINPPSFSERERRIWRVAFPTIYSYTAAANKNWSTYVFDIIPTFALQKIEEAIHSRFFTDVQIWTPEYVVDPIAVGVRNDHVYPLVRWGEALKDSTGIAAMVAERHLPGFSFSSETKAHIADILWNWQWDKYFFYLDRLHIFTLRPMDKCKKHHARFAHLHYWNMNMRDHCGGVFCSQGDWGRH